MTLQLRLLLQYLELLCPQLQDLDLVFECREAVFVGREHQGAHARSAYPVSLGAYTGRCESRSSGCEREREQRGNSQGHHHDGYQA